MKIPDSPHVEIAILYCMIRDGKPSGSEIRDELKDRGYSKSLPAFYRIMAKLCDLGLVTKPEYEVDVVDGYTVKKARYRITSKGKKRYDEAMDTYLAMAADTGNLILDGPKPRKKRK